MHLPAHTCTIVHCSLHIGGLIGVGPIGRPGEPGLRGPSGSRGSKGDPGDPGIVLSAHTNRDYSKYKDVYFITPVLLHRPTG